MFSFTDTERLNEHHERNQNVTDYRKITAPLSRDNTGEKVIYGCLAEMKWFQYAWLCSVLLL